MELKSPIGWLSLFSPTLNSTVWSKITFSCAQRMFFLQFPWVFLNPLGQNCAHKFHDTWIPWIQAITRLGAASSLLPQFWPHLSLQSPGVLITTPLVCKLSFLWCQGKVWASGFKPRLGVMWDQWNENNVAIPLNGNDEDIFALSKFPLSLALLIVFYLFQLHLYSNACNLSPK